MFDLQKLIRPNIQNLEAYSSARDDFKGEARIYLDANESPEGVYNRYPDPYQSSLKARLSEIKGVDLSNIFIGNGSDEVIDLCFRIFCNPGEDKALAFSPSYGMYKVSAQINDIKLLDVPLTSDFELSEVEIEKAIEDDSIRLIFICSPNNPSGNKFQSEAIDKIISQFKGIVIIDEAYQDFSESESFLNRLSEYPNLIVMQTLSKAWGMAGLRLGMAFSSPQIISILNKVKPPYNVSQANQAEALRLLENTALIENRIAEIKTERERLKSKLLNIKEVKSIFPSEANFLLVKVEDANKTYQKLKEDGIIVRNRHKQVENTIRITVGTRTENDALIKSLIK